MAELDDMELLARFAHERSESAFSELVQRHINLVYGAALRQTSNTHAAEEITQAVFIVLARKASSLSRKSILAGWLYRTTRLTTANFQRDERRRALREQEAYMQSQLNEPGSDVWLLIAPLLDDAMAKLNDKDRDAIVLRFLENKSLLDVGRAIGISEDAAKMRVNRALEKLRRIFAKRGVALGLLVLGSALAAGSAKAASANLATKAAAAATAVTYTGSTLTLAQATLKSLAWAKYKWLAIFGGATASVVGTAVTVSLFQPPAAPPVAVAQTSNAPAAVAATPIVPINLPPRDPFTSSTHLTLGVAPGAVAIQSDGKIVVGTTLSGFFVDEKTGVLGSYRRGIIRFNPDGSLDRTLLVQVNDVNASDAMRSHLELLPDGRILMNGLFKSVDDVARPGYTMLLADGRVDESFEPFRGITNDTVRTFSAVATRGATLLAEGSIAVMNSALEGTDKPYLLTAYRLDPSGRAIPRPDANLPLPEFSRPSGLALTLSSLGFWTRRPIDWTQATRAGKRPPELTRFPSCDFPFERWTNTPSAGDAAAVFRALFEEMPLELCRYAVRLPDGGVVMAVRTEFINGSRTGRGSLMRFDKDWRPDLSFTNSYEIDSGSCITLKLQKDGKVLVAGLAGNFNGVEFPGLIRLQKDGSIDPSFHCEATEMTTNDPTFDSLRRRIIGLTIDEAGRIVIAGFFTKVNGVEAHHLARLNPDGSLDQTFRTPFTTWEGLKQWRRVPVQSLTKVKSESGPSASASASVPTGSDVAAPPQTVLITSLRLQNGDAMIEFSGVPRQAYILQAGNLLEGGDWTNILTNRANAAGLGFFRDSDAKNRPMRFYRIAVP